MEENDRKDFFKKAEKVWDDFHNIEHPEHRSQIQGCLQKPKEGFLRCLGKKADD